MKKIIALSLCALLIGGLEASAQHTKDTTAAFSIADSASFTGKYKYDGLPFQYMEIKVKDGKLVYSGGEYNGTLEPAKDVKDEFDASGQAIFTFLRNTDNKVAKLEIDYQGQKFLGVRETK